MPVDPLLARIVGEWMQKAASDLRFADLALRNSEEIFAEAACFHSQQSIEKQLKALLLSDGQDAPRTHNIETLGLLAPEPQRPSLSAAERETISKYAVDLRYITMEAPTPDEAKAAVEAAERVDREGRHHLAPMLAHLPGGAE